MTQNAAKVTLTLTDSIAIAIDQSCKFWNAQDYRGLHDLWDPNETEPWYIAEDLEAPLIGWAGIEAAWQTSLGLAERDELRFSNLQTKPLGAGFALAIYTLRYHRKIAGRQQPLKSESRVTAIFRRHKKSWRFCHLTESSMSLSISVHRDFEGGPGLQPEITAPTK